MGIRNILALRGDAPNDDLKWEKQESGLNYATDMVKLINEAYPNDFTICVAGIRDFEPFS